MACGTDADFGPNVDDHRANISGEGSDMAVWPRRPHQGWLKATRIRDDCTRSHRLPARSRRRSHNGCVGRSGAAPRKARSPPADWADPGNKLSFQLFVLEGRLASAPLGQLAPFIGLSLVLLDGVHPVALVNVRAIDIVIILLCLRRPNA